MVVAAASMVLAACSAGPQSAANATANAEKITVENGSVENRVIATGKVIARAQSSIAFPQSGVVTAVMVTEGQQVKKGDALATLDTADLTLSAQQQWASYLSAQAAYSESIKGPSAAEIRAAQASIASAGAQIASAKAGKDNLYVGPSEADLVQVKADLQNAEVELQSAQAAYDRAFRQNPAGIGASQEAVSLEKATNNYNKAKAAYDVKFQQPTSADVASADAQISSANSQIQSARQTLDALKPVSETIQQRDAQMQQAYVAWQQAQEKIKNATLVAPFDGLVTAVNYEVGDWANTGAAAVQLADFSVPIFEVDVDEADLGGIKAGQDARVRLQTYPNQPIAAKVESVSTVGSDTGTIVTYKVKLSLGQAMSSTNTASPDAAQDVPTVLISMSGTSEIVTAKAEGTAVVPSRALTIDSATNTYTVERLLADGKTEKVVVKLGYRDSDKAQILEGVKTGDTLVIPTRALNTGVPAGVPPPQ